MFCFGFFLQCFITTISFAFVPNKFVFLFDHLVLEKVVLFISALSCHRRFNSL
jgi:hypothetical protein